MKNSTAYGGLANELHATGLDSAYLEQLPEDVATYLYALMRQRHILKQAVVTAMREVQDMDERLGRLRTLRDCLRAQLQGSGLMQAPEYGSWRGPAMPRLHQLSRRMVDEGTLQGEAR